MFARETVPAGAAAWRLRPVFRAIHVLPAVAAAAALVWSAERQGLGSAARTTLDGLAQVAGRPGESSITRATGRLFGGLWPPQLSEETPVAELPADPRSHLPPFARIETRDRSVIRINPATFALETHTERQDVLVRPFGYLARVAGQMGETVEMGLLATLIGVGISLPLAVLAARNYAPFRAVYHGARALIVGLRAVPELVSALFLVLAYGFGPAAGVLALSLHCTGFLGKFFAEEIEQCDRAPQEALAALGAGRLRTLRFAVWPQVLPHYAGYVCYVLDRNVRMATVIGLVGAGGIGQELKGRYDLFQYGHVMTIMLAIFLVVLALDRLSDGVRARLS
jgi:phosphonate transport system permease protein